jgi:hypothetical protein
VLEIGPAPDSDPVVFEHVLIHLDRRGVERVHPVPVASRDPVLLAGLDIEVVCLEALPLQRLEGPALIRERRSALGVGDATDPRWPNQTSSLLFNWT